MQKISSGITMFVALSAANISVTSLYLGAVAITAIGCESRADSLVNNDSRYSKSY